MSAQEDDYRSSDDEDYVPEAAGDDVEDESEGEQVDEVTGADGEILSGRRRRGGKAESKKANKKESKRAEPSVDVDAIFAAMMEEDARLMPQQTTSPAQETAPSTSAPPTSSSVPEETTKTVTEIFDFAGEEISIQKEVSTAEFERFEEEKKRAAEKAEKKPTQKRVGLGDALTLLKKKPKISILDKSNHDWDKFKQDNDLQEELQTFNRGKHGFVEKTQFLARTDLREFENEKSLRASARRK